MKPGKTPLGGIPVDTYQAARQIYNPSHIYLLIGDQTDELFDRIDLQLSGHFAFHDDAMISRVSMVTAFQYAESIPDIVASDATRKRMDWKYALHLPVHHQGVPVQAMCAFRQSMYCSQNALQEFGRLLEHLEKIGLYAKAPRDPLTSSSVLRTVCQITRLNQLRTGMKAALSLLASTAPDWVRSNMPPHWYGRYKTGQLHHPADMSQQEMQDEAEKIGADIHFLLTVLHEQKMTRLFDQAEIQHITRLLIDQFETPDGQIHWRLPGCASCSSSALMESTG